MNRFVVDYFEECVLQHPSNIALILADGNMVTYKTLNSLATIIQQLVFQTATNSHDSHLVAVMTDRNVSFIVAMLGILKAGATYVPVDPSFPPDRQAHIFNHSKCAFLIIDQDSYSAAISLGVDLPPYILMDARGNCIDIKIPNIYVDRRVSENEIIAYRSILAEERLAYVLYTSGSTGKPKGVMVKNIGVINIINWFADQLGVNTQSRVMGLTTFCFDISVLEMCVPLTRGAALVLAPSALQKDPFQLLELMAMTGVTVFQATPTTYEMMLATGWTGSKTVDFLVRCPLLSLLSYTL